MSLTAAVQGSSVCTHCTLVPLVLEREPELADLLVSDVTISLKAPVPSRQCNASTTSHAWGSGGGGAWGSGLEATAGWGGAGHSSHWGDPGEAVNASWGGTGGQETISTGWGFSTTQHLVGPWTHRDKSDMLVKFLQWAENVRRLKLVTAGTLEFGRSHTDNYASSIC